MFAIVIGVLILIQGAGVFVLRKARDELKDVEWAPSELTSRAIHRVPQHEKCEFRYIQKFEDKHLKVLGLDKKKKKKTQIAGMDVSDGEEHDGYSFDDDEDDMDYSIRSDFDHQNPADYEEGWGNDRHGGTLAEHSQYSGDESERSYRGGRGTNSRRRTGGYGDSYGGSRRY